MYTYNMFETPDFNDVIDTEMSLMDEIFQVTERYNNELNQLNWPNERTEENDYFYCNEKKGDEQEWTIDELLNQAAATEGINWLTNANQNHDQNQKQNQNTAEERREIAKTGPCQNTTSAEKWIDSSQMVAQVVECEIVPYDDNAIYLNW